jgi:hypothetical protein
LMIPRADPLVRRVYPCRFHLDQDLILPRDWLRTIAVLEDLTSSETSKIDRAHIFLPCMDVGTHEHRPVDLVDADGLVSASASPSCQCGCSAAGGKDTHKRLSSTAACVPRVAAAESDDRLEI